MRVHTVKSTGVDMPPMVKGRLGAKLPGGLPPKFKSTGVFAMAATKGSRDRLRGFWDANKSIPYMCVVMR